MEHLCRAFALERGLSRRAVVEHGSEREDVASAVEWSAVGLFRRHVARSSGDGLHDGQAGIIADLGDAEITDPYLRSVATQEDVCGLYIAVYDSFAMHDRKGLRGLGGETLDEVGGF